MYTQLYSLRKIIVDERCHDDTFLKPGGFSRRNGSRIGFYHLLYQTFKLVWFCSLGPI